MADAATTRDGGGLLRPAVVWFGESLNDDVMERAHEELEKSDLCMVVTCGGG